jgi:hypothetical protein
VKHPGEEPVTRSKPWEQGSFRALLHIGVVGYKLLTYRKAADLADRKGIALKLRVDFILPTVVMLIIVAVLAASFPAFSDRFCSLCLV